MPVLVNLFGRFSTILPLRVCAVFPTYLYCFPQNLHVEDVLKIDFCIVYNILV